MQRVPTYRPSLEEALGGKPTEAEAKVLAAAKAGEVAELSPDGFRPEEPSVATRIRAALVRFLMLGGDDANPVHPRGVMIQGAWIAAKLDLEACETQLDLKLAACHFDDLPDFTDSHLGGLYLPGSKLPGLRGIRIRIEDNLHLRALLRDEGPLPFVAMGPVVIAGARIGGTLSCIGGRFNGAGDRALNADAMSVGVSVFLRDGFHAKGEVNLIQTTIAGQLDCSGGRFDGDGGRALNGTAMAVGTDVFLRDGFTAIGTVNLRRAEIAGMLQVRAARFEGEIDLTESRAGVLVDDAVTWQQATSVKFSGFRFRSVQSRMAVAERLKLLNRSYQEDLAVTATGKRHFTEKPRDFDPRAYGELARAYLRQGERKAAALVLEVREDRSRDAELRRVQAEELPGFAIDVTLARLRWLAMWVFKGLFGYGHRPARVFVTLIPLWLALALFFGTVYDKGQFTPNSDVIVTSTGWLDAVKDGCPLPSDETFAAKTSEGCDMPLTLWTGDTSRALPPSNVAKDYETFNPVLYAADLFLPLNTIGQTEAWAPSKDRGTWGWWGYYLRFPVQLFGWIVVAMSAAILTGLIGRRED